MDRQMGRKGENMTMDIRWARLVFPLRFNFKHAAAKRSKSSSILVEVKAGPFRGYGEACPRPYVTGETEESVVAFLEKYGSEWVKSVRCIETLRNRVREEEDLINKNPAAFSALEVALIDILAQEQNVPVETLLQLPLLKGHFQYSAVLGDSSPLKTCALACIYRLIGFTDYKVKMGSNVERDHRRFESLPNNIRLRVDANNLYDDVDKCVNHFKDNNRKIWAIEEPLRIGDVEGQTQLAKLMKLRIILDESLLTKKELPLYEDSSLGWIANVRVSKNGGILRSIELAQAAQERGMDVILGAHVGETSLLTRAALTVGQALKKPAIAREGAFGKILVTKDISDPSLRFGARGIVDAKRWNFADRPGLGLSVDPIEIF